ncbi:hypothetical protein L249_6996 [Ophiocordyceps polyrhachis-furcata BCC 54312]|uniref:Clock-controlled pheromone ccg-4 n=1 Tax=Ophiocordyceps polyrhachis-furcata BCC 54312 TaxID=1330021 RepID=A0A367LKV9_9HYPO|nr:hypothetical protein L249_6996 [Ophiocordyceps polyrhachis-furcata BCC 54312]
MKRIPFVRQQPATTKLLSSKPNGVRMDRTDQRYKDEVESRPSTPSIKQLKQKKKPSIHLSIPLSLLLRPSIHPSSITKNQTKHLLISKMKFTSSITLFFVAAALAAPSPQYWCRRPNVTCKRATSEASAQESTSIAAPAPLPGAVADYCKRPGSTCKRATPDVLADILKQSEHLTKRDSTTDNAAVVAAHGAIQDLAHMVALTTEDPDQYIQSLNLPSAQHNLERRGRASGACGRRVMCWKRDLEQATVDDKENCHLDDGACSLVKRAAGMVLQSADAAQAAQASTCRSGGTCFRMKRDYLAIRSVADSIADSF